MKGKVILWNQRTKFNRSNLFRYNELIEERGIADIEDQVKKDFANFFNKYISIDEAIDSFYKISTSSESGQFFSKNFLQSFSFSLHGLHGTHRCRKQ